MFKLSQGKFSLIVFVFLIVVILFGFVVEKFNLHELENLIMGLGLFSLALFLTLILLIFLSDSIYIIWWKFTRIYIPIAFALIVFMTISESGGAWGVGAGLDGELTVWFTSGIFLIASMIIIIWKSIQLRKEDKNEAPTEPATPIE